MKEKRKEKDFSSLKHKKKKKKHKKKYESSSSSESDSNKHMQWVEASSVQDTSSKKKKKKHKRKKYESSSSSETESSDNKCTMPKSSSEYPEKEERDSWMSEESFVPTLSKDQLLLSSSRQKKIDSIREQRERDQKIQKERELNPYMKNEGSGLPEKEAAVENLSLPSTSVGDGGYSWLKKAYYRIQEQAQQEGRSMEEIAVERWGSLSKLTSMIEEAEERMKTHPDWKKKHHDKFDRDSKYSRVPFKKPSSDYESRRGFESSFEFKKPSDTSRNRKVLNQFKSSRHSNSHHYDQLDEREDSRTSSLNDHFKKEQSPKSKEHGCDIEAKYSNNKNRTPAWKKPKYVVEEKEVLEKSKAEISEDIVMYSEDDLSKLAAKQIKAEIMGDSELAQKLKQQLDDARLIVEKEGFAKKPVKKVEEVILTKIDNHGNARPLNDLSQEKISDYKQKNSRKKHKYFDEDASYSLKQMFEREKLMTSDDQMEMFVEASSQVNETDEIDYESGNISKKLSQKLASGRQEEKDIGRAMQQHQKKVASLERCEYCLDQPRMKKYLIIDVGNEVYLSLPNFQTMTEGHCLIVPKAHVPSFLSLDENEQAEVNDYKNHLRNLFRSENKSVIFLETSMNFRYFPHAVLECIPVPEEEGDMAPFYFKKAIQESEAEWALNKKLIDLTNKGLKHSVPKNLPYFHVEFDPKIHAGYAHVIEDEKCFPRNFGKEVVGGMLDIDYNYLYKNKKEDSLKKSKEVVEFEKKWKKFKM